MITFRSIFFLIIGIWSLSIAALQAQRLLDRFVPYVIQPHNGSTAGSLRGWGSFEGYLFQTDSLHGWRQVMGAMVDFWRRDTTLLLSFVATIEFHANFNNDIFFNPRAQFWEEGIVLSFYTSRWILQTGYLHRCKHDIDNLALQQERVLIYGSFFGNCFYEAVPKTDSTGVLLGLSSHLFVVHEDYRVPADRSRFDPRISTLFSTNVLSLQARLPIFGNTIALRAHIQAASFSRSDQFTERLRYPLTWRFSFYGAVEYFLSSIARFRLSIERLHDTLIPAIPESAIHIQLGINFVPQAMW